MENKVLTVCPYCSAGCRLYLVVEGGKIKRAEPALGRTNIGFTCSAYGKLWKTECRNRTCKRLK